MNVLMEATGWSWPELMTTPLDVIRRHQTYLAVKNARETKTDMRFPGES